MADVLLEVRDIVKSFPGVRALDGVSLVCRRGEVHALVGENGAGKSTLMRLIAGVESPDSGEIIYAGQRVAFRGPRDAQRAGIATIYQELNLLPNLTVAENILLGNEPVGRGGLIDRPAERRRVAHLLQQLDAQLPLDKPTGELGVAQQQIVEIAKALAANAELIIMDEPSAVLAGHELEQLFQVIATLKARNVTILYVSHRLDEIFRIADRVTILKDGRVTGDLAVAEASKAQLIRLMVGRPLAETFPERDGRTGEPLLEAIGLSSPVLRDVSLTLRRGEIVGLAGLVGAGRTELARALFGVEPATAGEIRLRGRALPIRSPSQAIGSGLGFVTEDRKAEGLVLGQSLRKNVALPSLGQRQRLGLVQEREERRAVRQVVDELQVRAPGIEAPVALLSGGNQQKVVLAKWLVTRPEVLIFDEPTRGIDVGAKAEFYRLMRELADQGKAILMISSELPEILGMSDRILVMHQGRIAGELAPAEATEERIMTLATGGEGLAPEFEATLPRGVVPADERPSSPLSGAMGRLFGGSSSRTVLTIYGLLLALVLLAAVLSPPFRSLANTQNILRQSVALGLVSVGQTIVILAGGIDISVSSVITLTAVLNAGIIDGEMAMAIPAVLLCLALGALVGLANGLLVTRLRLPPFIATFGTWSIVRGIVLLYTSGPVGFVPRPFRFLADGHIGPLPFPVLILAAVFALAVVAIHGRASAVTCAPSAATRRLPGCRASACRASRSPPTSSRPCWP
jgi:ribose transport system ATP-binding protein